MAEGERMVRLGAASMPRAARAAVAVLLLVLVGLAAYMLLRGAGGWIVAVTVVVVAASLATAASSHVRIMPKGFDARSLTGRLRTTTPIVETESARAVHISPFGEFGGWGWRIAVDGRTGIVMRRGAAIEVYCRDRRPFIVTIGGVEEAVALLQVYVDRDRATGERRS